jgi:hypothetical protein
MSWDREGVEGELRKAANSVPQSSGKLARSNGLPRLDRKRLRQLQEA